MLATSSTRSPSHTDLGYLAEVVKCAFRVAGQVDQQAAGDEPADHE
ncbi:hypothetical protein [Streptomyces nitrosporeus]|nr:hypothetical protein [Streptomyces nitrosporeus]